MIVSTTGMPRRFVRFSLFVLAGLSGCASVREMTNYPEQGRLDRLVMSIAPCSSSPDTHNWVRVPQPKKKLPDMWVSGQRHVYFSERLIKEADDQLLTMLLAHGVAHYELHHLGHRSVLGGLEYLGFFAGGLFVPGLGLGYLLTTPVIDAVVGVPQEFRADVKALSCLEQMGYTVDDYVKVLEFMRSHHFTERTRYLFSSDEQFASRVKAIRQLGARLKTNVSKK